MKTVKHLIKDNHGAGYIWFIGMTVVMLLFFGALFGVIKINVETKNIRQNIDNAVENVFVTVKHSASNSYGQELGRTDGSASDSYDALIKGATDNTYVQLTGNASEDPVGLINDQDYQFLKRLAQELNLDVDSYSSIEKKDTKDNMIYKISNLKVTYIPSVYSTQENSNTETVQGTNARVIKYKIERGDLNNDNAVDDVDITLLEKYLKGENPNGLILKEVDINQDGIANSEDVLVLQQIALFFASTTPQYKAQAMYVVNFDLEVAINLGAYTFGTTTNRFSYPLVLTFKDADSYTETHR